MPLKNSKKAEFGSRSSTKWEKMRVSSYQRWKIWGFVGLEFINFFYININEINCFLIQTDWTSHLSLNHGTTIIPNILMQKEIHKKHNLPGSSLRFPSLDLASSNCWFSDINLTKPKGWKALFCPISNEFHFQWK